MKLKLFLMLLLTSATFAGKINIAIAANVSYVIKDLKKEFNKLYPDIQVDVTLGGTGKLVAQIKHNAPYQILLAANMDYPQALYDSEETSTRPLVYAQGSLIALSTKEQNLSDLMNLLQNDKIKRIAVANPKTAPYGQASLEAFKNAHSLKKIQSKFVYAESISQTVTYALKVADIGFIAKSTLFSPKMKQFKEGKHWVNVSKKLYTPISQGVVILKKGEGNSDVSAFYAFLFSKRAEEIFKHYGYLIP